jgi:peptide/nickel transport system permease protein
MSATTDIGVAAGVVRARRERALPLALLVGVLRFMRRKPLGGIGLVIVTALFICAVFAPLIAPYSYERQRLSERFLPPSSAHLLGTDDRGRDMFSRVVYGARVSVFVGFGVIATSMLLATTIGTLTGYYGGKLDLAVQRIVDVFLSIPFLILALTLTAILPKPDRVRDIGPLSLDPAAQGGLYIVLALGISFSIGSSRVIRGAVLAIKGNQYMEAARGLGATDGRMLRYYVLPNVFPTILILATVQLGAAILAESSLQFLGFGIPPPVPSWGGMLGGVARTYITQEPLLSIWPGLAIAVTVFGFNMLGDALRDVLDPRLRGSR